MCYEQSRLLHLCDVGLAVSWLLTFLGPMAKLAAVAAGIVSWLVLVSSTALGASAAITLGTYLRPGLGAFPRLARLATLAATCCRGGLPLLVTLAGIPLPPSEELPTNVHGPQERLWLITVDDLEATYHLLDQHRGEVQQRLPSEPSACTSRGCRERASRQLSPCCRCRRRTAQTSAT